METGNLGVRVATTPQHPEPRAAVGGHRAVHHSTAPQVERRGTCVVPTVSSTPTRSKMS